MALAPGRIVAPHKDIFRRALYYYSEDNTTQLGIDVASVFVADGEPFLHADETNFLNISIDLSPIVLTATMAVDLCNVTLGH